MQEEMKGGLWRNNVGDSRGEWKGGEEWLRWNTRIVGKVIKMNKEEERGEIFQLPFFFS